MSNRDEFKTIFLIVSERSGANLLLNMVAAHPDLCAPLPPHFFRHMTINRARYGDLEQTENWRSFLDDTQAFSENISEPWSNRLSIDEFDQRVKKRSFEEALRVIMDAECENHAAKYALLKENEVYQFMPALLVAFPCSRFVWQVRDPRDMMTSFKRSTLFTKLIPDPIGVWQLEQQQTLNVYPFLKERNRIHFHRYEDLISEPEEILGKLCSFIGVEFDVEMLDFHKGELARRRANTSDLRKNVAKPIMSDNAGKYRTELSEEEIKSIEKRVGQLMGMLGYRCEYPPLIPKEHLLTNRQEMILSDQSTPLEDRKIRARRIDVIRKMLLRPFVSPTT